MAAKSPAKVSFNGHVFNYKNVSQSFQWASLYENPMFYRPMVRFHRTEASAAKGMWDSEDMRAQWKLIGIAPITR